MCLDEQLLLLALRDEHGSRESGVHTALPYVLAGALLTELALARRVELRHDRDRVLVVPSAVIAAAPPCEARLDSFARGLGAKSWSARDWIEHVAKTYDLVTYAARSLLARGVVMQKEDRILGFRWRIRYPEAREGPEQRVMKELWRVIATDTPSVPARTAALVGLADAGGLLKIKVHGEYLKPRRARIAALSRSTSTAVAAKAAIEAVEAAMVAASVALSAATIVSSS